MTKLTDKYTSPTKPAAVGSAKKLRQAPGMNRKMREDFLCYSKTFSKFQQVARIIKLLEVRSLGINDTWSMDVAFIEKSPIITACIDISWSPLTYFQGFSAFNQSNRNLRQLSKMLTSEPGKFPFKIWTDQNSECRGEFKQFSDQNQLEIHQTFSKSKSSLTERCIRTLKVILYKVFEESGSHKNKNYFQKMVKFLNSRLNRSIVMAPAKFKERGTQKCCRC